ncbi:uncharacterized protein LOC143196985 isoform X2 [Rhynchophorus ferrugineus]|uniref:uncharacterized protein LOC143196985 isoform X2 n=1 Tax=Rhynchophorus ferrugineus TaxID=354439 RepID=UPI003FCD4955
MGRYLKMVQRNAYILSFNKKGSCSTSIKKWEIIKKLTGKVIADENAGRFPHKECHNLDPGVQLLPRQDVLLYGTFPKMEPRVYSKCRECNRVFNPCDILSHKNCSKIQNFIHPSLLKKKMKNKSGIGKKTSTISNTDSNLSSSNNNPSVVAQQSGIFKRPFTPPPLSNTPQHKVSVTKIGLSKVVKTTTTVSAASNTATSTTSSYKSDPRVSSSSKTTSSVHNSSRAISSIRHGSKSSSVHNHQKSSSHHGPRSPSSVSSYASPKSPSSVHHSRHKSPSRNLHSGSHHSSTHVSSKSLPSSKSADMVPSSSSQLHHSSSSISSFSSSNSHSNKPKKSASTSSPRKSSSSATNLNSNNNKILVKDYDPDMHCGVVEGSKGPCMRSITCSNHRIQLRKLVSGRSKDIHQLIAERKAAKEKDLKPSALTCSYTPPNGEAKDTLNTIYVPVVAKIANTNIESAPNSYVPIMPRVSGNQQSRELASYILTSTNGDTENEKNSSVALTNGYISHSKNMENSPDNVGTVPVIIMPMSPVSVVSSVQFLKIGNNIISLESPQSATTLTKQLVTVPIQSNQSNNLKMYKSHPKPVVVPSFGAKRVGSAILLANPCLKSQRNELLKTLNNKKETVNNNRGISLLNYNNSPHRPNILKVKSGNKVNCKRPANDKIITSDSKRVVPDVNGFIIHADVSETANAPQSNNCIQEKIAILNMK